MRSWRLWLSGIQDTLEGHGQARLEEYWDTVSMEAVIHKGGEMEAETQSIG